MADGQSSITVPTKLFDDIQDVLPHTNYNSVAGFSQFILNREVERIKKEAKK